ncbi:hypothetical protein IP79_10360 [Porphyrobacter sp. AAP60]|nr:hypothetical protein IP79_10360 [Porphyrobacter sp. AAP60]
MSRNAGGLFNSVRQSAIHLAKAGAQVSVYALEDEHSAADLCEWKPLVPQVLPTLVSRHMPYAPDLDRQVAAADHDFLHLHGIWQLTSRSVNCWKRRTGRPVMISPRGMLDPWALANSAWKKKLVGAWFENRNLREADCLHALNASEAASMRRYGLTGPIAIIPNATDIPGVAVRTIKTGRRTLLFLGRIHPKKGLKELISAWARARRARPELAEHWQLQIAGWDDGGHTDPLNSHILALGQNDSVELTGPAFGSEKDTLLRSADAFVLPSFSEGLPMSVLEAWAYRLPVLMTAECNLPEGFKSGAAIKVSTDPDALAGQLAKALLDTDLPPLGEVGRSLVEECFSWPSVAARHLEVYRWMVEGGEPPACVRLVRA